MATRTPDPPDLFGFTPAPRKQSGFYDDRLPATLEKAAADWPDDYAEKFWDVAVRKVDKLDAMRALDRAKRRGISWEVLFPAWVRYNEANAERARDPNERHFIKHPATWLNKGSYGNGEDVSHPNRTAPGAGAVQRQPANDPVLAGLGRLARRRADAHDHADQARGEGLRSLPPPRIEDAHRGDASAARTRGAGSRAPDGDDAEE